MAKFNVKNVYTKFITDNYNSNNLWSVIPEDEQYFYAKDYVQHRKLTIKQLVKEECGPGPVVCSNWRQYMSSPEEKVIYDWVQEIELDENAVPTPNYLARIFGLKYGVHERALSGLFFWRIFKRLYYKKFKQPIPFNKWKAICHYNRVHDQPLAVFEDMVLTTWNSMHGTKFRSHLFRYDHLTHEYKFFEKPIRETETQMGRKKSKETDLKKKFNHQWKSRVMDGAPRIIHTLSNIPGSNADDIARFVYDNEVITIPKVSKKDSKLHHLHTATFGLQLANIGGTCSINFPCVICGYSGYPWAFKDVQKTDIEDLIDQAAKLNLSQPSVSGMCKGEERQVAQEQAVKNIKDAVERIQVLPKPILKKNVTFMEKQMFSAAQNLHATAKIVSENRDAISNFADAAGVVVDKKEQISEMVDDMSTASKTAKQSMADLQLVLQQLKITIESVSQATRDNRIGRLMEKVERVVEQSSSAINRVSQSFMESAEGTPDKIVTILFRLVEVSVFYLLLDVIPGWLWAICLGVRLLFWFELDKHITHMISWLWTLIPKYSRGGVREMRTEAFGDFTGGARILAMSALGVGSLLVNGMLPQRTSIERFVKTLDLSFSLNRSLDSFPKLFNKLASLFDQAICWIFKTSSVNQELLDRMHDIDPRIRTWAERVSTLARADTSYIAESDVQLQNEILGLRAEAVEYVALFNDQRVPQQLRFAFQNVYNDCKKLGDMVDNVKHFKPFRYDPFCVWISGAPRIGKSFLATNLARDMAVNIGHSPEGAVYTRSITKHWDMYNTQPVVYFDDMGQERGTAEELRWNEFMLCRSNAGYLPPRAFEGEKGRPFLSKVLIASSNQTHPNTNTVADLTALLERRHLVFKAFLISNALKDEFGVPDATKIREYQRTNGQFSHLIFARCNPLGGVEPVTGDMSYEEVRNMILQKQSEHDLGQNECIADYYRQEQRAVRGMQAQMMSDDDDFMSADEQRTRPDGDTLEPLPMPFESRPPQYDQGNPEPAWTATMPEHVRDVVNSRPRQFDLITNSAAEQVYEFTNYDRAFIIHFEVEPLTNLLVQSESEVEESVASHVLRRLNGFSNPQRVIWYNYVRSVYDQYDQSFERRIRLATNGTRFVRAWKSVIATCKSTVQKVADFLKTNINWQKIKNFLKYAAIFGLAISMLGGLVWMKKKANDMENPLKTPIVFRGTYPNLFPCSHYLVKQMKDDPVELVKYENKMKKSWEALKSDEDRKVYLATLEANLKVMFAEGASGDAATNRQSKVRVVTKTAAKSKPTRETTAEAAVDPNAIDLRNHKIVDHLWTITNEDDTARVKALAINGQNLLLPFHFVNYLKEGEICSLFGAHLTINFAFNKLKSKRIAGYDLAVIQEIPRLPVAPDMVKYFLKNEDLQQMFKFDGELVTRIDSSKNKGYIAYPTKVQAIDLWPEYLQHDISISEKHIVREGWVHDAPTTPGDCGAILIAHNPRYPRKVIGMHVSGFGKGEQGGACALLTQEIILPYLTEKAVCQTQCQFQLEKEWDGSVIPENYEVLGHVPKSLAVWQPAKSDIRPSVLHDLVAKHVTEPSVLSPLDPRCDPGCNVWQGLSKYSDRTIPFKPLDIEMVADAVHQEHMHKCPPKRRLSVTTMDMAINGAPIDNYKPLDMLTSAGYPWKLQKPQNAGPGKKWLFNNLGTEQQPHYEPNAALMKRVLECFKMMLQGRIPFWVWVHCLKDERRKLEKIRRAKTRLFTMAPVELTIITRMLTMDFVASFIGSHCNFYSAVGVDPNSPKWSQMFWHMARNGRAAGDGDYEAYDGKLDPDLIFKTLEIIGRWYLDNCKSSHFTFNLYGHIFRVPREKLLTLFYILACVFVHSYQICMDILHRKSQGNPSGNALTAILNTIVGLMLLMLCFILLARAAGEYNMATPEFFFKYVVPYIFGDDNMFSTNTKVSHFFNVEALAYQLSLHGIVYTPADKSGYDLAVKDVKDLRFLKCGFRPHPEYSNVILAPIEWDTIMELLNWVREGPDNIGQCREQCNNALRFAHAHGARVYRNLVDKINEAIAKAGNPFRPFSDQFIALEQEFLSQFH